MCLIYKNRDKGWWGGKGAIFYPQIAIVMVNLDLNLIGCGISQPRDKLLVQLVRDFLGQIIQSQQLHPDYG